MGHSEIKKQILELIEEVPAGAKRKELAASIMKELEKVVDRPVRRPGNKLSKAWKGLERLVAETLKARRVLRGSDFSVKDVDVISEFRALRIDAKYRNKHAHHTFMAEIERKYCVKEGDVPVLVTKHPGQDGAYVTVPLKHYGELIELARYQQQPKIDLLNRTLDIIKGLRFKPFPPPKPRDED